MRIKRYIVNLNHMQRAAIILAWGALLVLTGQYIASAWSIFGPVDTLPRRVGYAPLQALLPRESRIELTGLECFFVWIGLILVWLVSALLLLKWRPPPVPVEGTDGRTS